ncbi:MAG: hypothetical protein KGS72_19950 [Cyanobacteria bacterium REEB67]|nr:hypothetical protein [Cyanobacteria bacterium REEB67]
MSQNADHANAHPSFSDKISGVVTDTVTAVKDTAQHLFEEAYEHPVKAAEVAGGVALGAAALYAARSQVFRAAGKEVLLVEDTAYMGKAFKSTLEANGEKVTWLTGVNRASPLTGITAEGKEMIFDPRKYKVAFVDGDLKGSYLQGQHVVNALKQSGLHSIATSSEPSLNKLMLDNGATIAAPKATVLNALIENRIDFRQVLANPSRAQSSLNGLTEAMQGVPGKPLRARGDALLMKFISEDPTL